MNIWFQDLDLEKMNKDNDVSLQKLLQITLVDYGPNFLTAKMPINENSKQTLGHFHGGLSCVLAETVGSIASNYCIDFSKKYAVGLEINANHLRPVISEYIFAKAINLHLGKKTHVWDIRLTDQNNKLVCISRLTTAVVDRF